MDATRTAKKTQEVKLEQHHHQEQQFIPRLVVAARP
jgi:hypothetical protein